MAAKLYSALSKSEYRQRIFGMLTKDMVAGLKFYQKFSNQRLKNAIRLFSPSMKKALYETLFLLHFNHPSFRNFHLPAKTSGDNQRAASNSKAEVDLFVNNAPAGVLGFSNMSAIFFKDMQTHIQREYRVDIAQLPPLRNYPIVSICSLGSIGTIAHKLEKSDLDLQIQYDISPYLISEQHCNDSFFADALDFFRQQAKKQRAKLTTAAFEFDKNFPLISRFQKKKDLLKDVGNFLKLSCEVTKLYDIYDQQFFAASRLSVEQRLQKRIKNIERFISSKYPDEDMHFFAYSTDNYRQGFHGSTLESKESSGSAYEKILTYDTLMPGIQYNSVVPSHFIFGDNINKNESLYQSIIACLRLRLFDDGLAARLKLDPRRIVDLGATPELSRKYLDEHRGAIYWEAFKGSSGNLPKAFLNLLRLESLYSEGQNRQTVIRLIKEPDTYKNLLSEIKAKVDQESLKDPYGLQYDEQSPFPLHEVYRLETQNPDLLLDPWWIKYKVLKIFYWQASFLDYNSKQDISLMIDTCFALHVGLDDIFMSQYTNLNEIESVRIRLLNDYFENAFPALTRKRDFIEKIFQGEVSNVNYFEDRLKKHFRDAISRILKQSGTAITAKAEEKRIWLQYYEQNFEPSKNQIPRNILSNINKASGRLQVRYQTDQWHFRTIRSFDQAKTSRFRVFGNPERLAAKVNLHHDHDLVRGLVYCIINKLYGSYERQNIKMSTSLIELLAHTYEDAMPPDVRYSKVNSKLLEMLATMVAGRFPVREVDYREAMQSGFFVTEIIFVINVLVFGRVQAIYRDRMDNYYQVTIDNKELNDASFKYMGKVEVLEKNPQIIDSICQVLKKLNMLKDRSPADLADCVSFWLNPLSFSNESNMRNDWLDKIEQRINTNMYEAVASQLGLTEEAEAVEKST